MQERQSKKSESLEVRLSHQTKKALYEKAGYEGRTVSDVVRHLISGYLSNHIVNEPRSGQYPSLKVSRARLWKPISLATSVMAAVASTMIFIPAANAKNVILNIRGDITNGAERDVSRRTISTSVLMDDEGGQLDLELGKSLNDGVLSNLVLRLDLNSTVLENNRDGMLIELQLIELLEDKETVIARPKLTVALEETARFYSESNTGTIDFSFNLDSGK